MQARLSSLTGMLTGESLSVVYYKNEKFKEWINNIVSNNPIDKILAFSSSMAQYLDEKTMEKQTKIMDLAPICTIKKVAGEMDLSA